MIECRLLQVDGTGLAGRRACPIRFGYGGGLLTVAVKETSMSRLDCPTTEPVANQHTSPGMDFRRAINGISHHLVS